MGSSFKEIRGKLSKIQNKLYSRNIPIIVMFEGPGGEIGSRIVNKFISALEPRGVEFHYFVPDTEIWYNAWTNFFTNIPARGKMAVYDKAWYSYLLETVSTKKDFKKELAFIKSFEEYLVDNGIFLLKIFLNITNDTVKKYGDDYVGYDSKCGTFIQKVSGVNYNPYSDQLSSVLKETDYVLAPWEVVEVSDPDSTLETICQKFEKNVEFMLSHPHKCPMMEIEEIYPNPRDCVDIFAKVDPKEYKKELASLQGELSMLQGKLWKSKKSLVLAFEGWDAAGKGGAIKRVTAALNPRGYKTYPISKPTDEEKSKTHLWRFANKLPVDGQIAIFDRTWYGRMLVEPIEKFCTKEEYSRAASEINVFEYFMTSHDTILLKFWLDITSDVQLERFTERENNPDKKWKITQEDWRNREKWDSYSKYVDSMIMQTNTDYAPWYVVESNDKKYARLKVLQIIISALKKELS